MGKDLYMPHDRYLAALKRQRARIASGLKLRAEDDDTPGNKSTSCSWGLCSDEKAAWPDAEDHLWPDQFAEQGRVAPKYLARDGSQRCPLNGDHPAERNGCFFKCRIFNPRGKSGCYRPSRNEAIGLYDAYIAKAEDHWRARI